MLVKQSFTILTKNSMYDYRLLMCYYFTDNKIAQYNYIKDKRLAMK